MDVDGPFAAVVVNLVAGTRYRAVRGGGATRDGEPIRTSGVSVLGEAIVGLSGLPPRHLGWRQFRALGAAALDLCAVADGTLDAFVDCSEDAHGVWDYLGGALVVTEAGGRVVDARSRALVTRDHAARRTPVAGATALLCRALVDAHHAATATSGAAP